MNHAYQPLAERMRPRCLQDYIGQKHLLTAGKPLYHALQAKRLHSMILWGSAGTGKTTLARLIAQQTQAQFITLSAVSTGIKEIRDAVQRAKQHTTATLVFVDEVHRFNKAQQDAFLPHIEDGTLYFIGATTENPSFALNHALLSRTRVYVLNTLTIDELIQLITLALDDVERGLGANKLSFNPTLQTTLAHSADGDARRLFNLLELCAELAQAKQTTVIDENIIQSVLGANGRHFDQHGDVFYQQISALHKAVRGSSPDAALYWLCRMLDGGCDVNYLARRLVRIASEDIGNADPRALELALNAWDVQQRLGSPEGELALAQAVIFLACAPKSNAVYRAYNQAMAQVKTTGSLPVPLHLRPADTAFMKGLGYGQHYRYAHDEPSAYAAGENYFPEALAGTQYYHPTERGLELKIGEKLRHLRELDAVYAQNKQKSRND